MNASDIKSRVIESVAELAGVSSKGVTSNTSFDALGLDSLGIVEISMELEDEFDIDFPYDAWESWNTVQDMINCVLQLVPVAV